MPLVRKGRLVFFAASLLVTGFVGLTWAQYRREIGRQRRRVSSGSQLVQTPCGPIGYAAAGSGAPVLLVHGIPPPGRSDVRAGYGESEDTVLQKRPTNGLTMAGRNAPRERSR